MKGLPKGLQKVATTRGHAFFVDPQARPVNTAVGYRRPGQAAYDIAPEEATRQTALDAIFGFDMSPAAKPAADKLDATFGLASAPASKTAAPKSRDATLDAIFGLEPASAVSVANDLESGPTASWDGTFSNPIGDVTDRTTSGFGHRSAPRGSLGIGSRNHAGIDLSADQGALGYAAEAAAPGIVTQAGPAGRYGNLVEITHPGGVTTRYGHLESIGVAVGDEVARGAPVGTVGMTGNTTGPHLHFEVRDQFGQPVDPEAVVDFTRRADLEVTPSARPTSPTEQRQAAAAYGNLAASLSQAGVLGVGGKAAAAAGLPAGFDTARFAPEISPVADVNPARFGGSVYTGMSSPLAPTPAEMAMAPKTGRLPSANINPDRFGPRSAAAAVIDPARFGGFAPTVGGPVSPAGVLTAMQQDQVYADMEARRAAAFSGMSAAASQAMAHRTAMPPQPSASRFGPSPEPDPARFGRVASPSPSFGSIAGPFSPASPAPSVAKASPIEMTTTPKTGRLSPAAAVAKSTPMSATPANLPASNIAADLSALGLPTRTASTVQAPASAMNFLPSNYAPPAGPFSQFNPAPATDVTTLAATTQPIAPAIPQTIARVPTPTARLARATPRNAPTPAPRPDFSAYDVHAGIAPAGYQAPASGGSLVSRDRFGNISVTNQFGRTTVTSPSGRQMAAWGDLDTVGVNDDEDRQGFGSRLGSALGKAAPGLIGGMVGNAIAGPAGGILGSLLGNRIAGQPASSRGKGLLGSLFGGGSRGGSSSGSKGGSSSGRGSGRSPSADRSHAGN